MAPAAGGRAQDRLAQALGAHRAGDLARAAAGYRAILADDPAHIEAQHLLGAAELQAGRADAALARFDRLLAQVVGQGPAAGADLRVPAGLHSNRAAALRQLGRPEEALAALDLALAQRADDAKALNNRAATLLDLQRPDDALDSARASLRLDPLDPAAHHNHAMILLALGDAPAALAACDAALARADLALLHANRANALALLGRPAEALASAEAALARDPLLTAAWLARGQALADLGRAAEALPAFAQARALEPALPFLPGQQLHARLGLCDWDGIEADFDALARGIAAGRPMAAPFVALLAPLPAALQQRCAQTFARHHHPLPVAPFGELPPPAPDGRLRVGVFSPNFHQHPSALLSVEVLECLDRQRIELHGFAFGLAGGDALRQRVAAACEHFDDVAALSDAQIVALARSRGLHLALDLGGWVRLARNGIFAQRAAPLQIAWLAFPGTSGAPWLDYIVADPVVLPRAHEAFFDETPLRLPHTYQPNDGRRPVAAGLPARAALGLPDEAVVFCAFHQSAKITPDAFALWLRLLRRVPGSVLWLLDPGTAARANLARSAQAQGVAAARLVFAPRLPLPDHLARHAAADLFLDTLHYGAHTSASDALWAGLPVLTRLGERFASRVAASLLHAVGLPELVADSVEAFEELGVALATDPARRAELRRRLAAQRESAPLFDAARYARNLEAGLAAVWQRHRAGLPRVALDVLDDAGGRRVIEA